MIKNLTVRQAEVLRMLREGWELSDIAKELNVKIKTIYNYKYQLVKKIGKDNLYSCDVYPNEEDDEFFESESSEYFKTDMKENSGQILSNSTKIRTVEDALEKAEIDTNIWDVDRVQVNSWEMPRKNVTKDIKWTNGVAEGYERDKGGFVKETMWQIKIWLKRKIKNDLEEALKSLTEDLRKNPPIILKNKIYKKSDNLLEISLIDHHFGKLCINGDGVKESQKIFKRAVEVLLSKVSNYDFERIVMPIGSDFFHINNINNATQKGTPQDTSGTLYDIYKVGCNSMVEAILILKEFAPVDLYWVPGNHDFETSFFLASYIDAMFHYSKNININYGSNPRKYIHFGTNLIGFTHGNEEPHRDLPSIMMYENKEILPEIETFEWHVGHYHKKKETKYSAGDTFGNVAVKVLPSLSGTDYWHYKKGYVGANKAAEAYVYNKEFGYDGHFSCNIKEIT